MSLSKGGCRCGEVQLELFLPTELSHYSARECDCDFCVNRKIAYLSDPKGKLKVISSNELGFHHQGSNQASFLECKNCTDVVAVVCDFNDGKRGAVNVTLLEQCEKLKPSEIASPKLLSAQEKFNRWRALWLDVELISGSSKHSA